MVGRFTEAARAELERLQVAVPAIETAAPEPAPPVPAPPIEVLSFGGRVLGRAALRTLRRPAFWVVLAVLAIVVLWFLTR
jgi:hypothetical protein